MHPDSPGTDLVSLVHDATAEPTVDVPRLESLCLQLSDRIARGDMIVGILPPDADEVLGHGLIRICGAGSAPGWALLGEHYLSFPFTESAPWTVDRELPDRADQPVGRSLRCFAEAARLGDRAGALRLAQLSRIASEAAKRLAMDLLEPFLDGDPRGEATYEYGLLQFHLDDPASALTFHQRAAGLGNADAMFELYIYYAEGIAVPVDTAEARRWLARAADHEHPRALHNLGGMYATGNGVNRDTRQAAGFYERAARAGNGRSAATLGVMLLTGEDPPADPDAADGWFEMAEDLGVDVDDFLDRLGLSRGRTGARDRS